MKPCTCCCNKEHDEFFHSLIDESKFNFKSNLSKKKKRFFEIARQVGLMSDFPKIKIGCVLVIDKKHIIGSGCNKQKTHPIQYKLNKKYKKNSYKEETSFIHAEIDALSSLSESFLYKKYYNLQNVEVYLYRESKNANGKTELQNCRPCDSCMQELLRFGIKKIHYTSNFGFHSEQINF